jgi:hypothetical protein
MLGYMPLLTFLSLDSCTGVGILIEGLKEKPVGAISITPPVPHKPKRNRGIKVCPRLESIASWGCGDVYNELHAVVTARNKCNAGKGDGRGADAARNEIGTVVTEYAKTGNLDENAVEVLTRKITPLRKPRRQDRARAGLCCDATILSTIIAMSACTHY